MVVEAGAEMVTAAVLLVAAGVTVPTKVRPGTAIKSHRSVHIDIGGEGGCQGDSGGGGIAAIDIRQRGSALRELRYSD